MNLLSLLLLAIGFNLIGFGMAYDAKTDKLTDFSYGATFIILALFAYLNGGKHLPQNLLLLLVLVWAIRLAGFLVLRILMINRDHRFDGVRENFYRFGLFWMGQAVSAFVILLPAIFVWRGQQTGFSVPALVGWTVAIIGLAIEIAADIQKYNFNLEPDNYGNFINHGLWKYSRHPNYFGEILMWIGVYVYCFSFMSFGERIMGLASPILITYLLLFVTGVPKLEKYADKKWGKQAAYRNYKKRTPVLVPLPPKLKLGASK